MLTESEAGSHPVVLLLFKGYCWEILCEAISSGATLSQLETCTCEVQYRKSLMPS